MIEDAVEGHVFVSGLFVIETGILKDKAEALSRFLLVGARIEAIQLDTSAGGVKEGREHFDGGGLARAVRSQEGEDLALGYFKGDIADGGEISKGLYQVLNRNHASLEGLHNDTERYRFNCQDGMVRAMAFANASRSLTKDGWPISRSFFARYGPPVLGVGTRGDPTGLIVRNGYGARSFPGRVRVQSCGVPRQRLSGETP